MQSFKNLLIVAFLLILILVLFGLNAEYGWIHFEWKMLAIGASALAGPFQYVKGMLDQKAEEKQLEDQRYKYRVLHHEEFVAREKRIAEESAKTQIITTPVQNTVAEPFYNETAIG